MTSHLRQRQAFAAMAAEMTVSDDARCVKHPSGWRFVVRGPRKRNLVLAAPPNYSLSAASYLVEGSAAAKVIELLEREAAQGAEMGRGKRRGGIDALSEMATADL